MTPTNPAPQGIEAILAALSAGGQPMGQLGQAPSPANPLASPMPAAMPTGGMTGDLPGLPATGAVDPLAAAMQEVDPQMLQLILQALSSGGAFNNAQPPVM